MLLSDKSRSLQYSLGFGGQGLSFTRMEKARSVPPWGRWGRRQPCCQHLGLQGDTMVVTCHHSCQCHPAGTTGCGHLCGLAGIQPTAPAALTAWPPHRPPGPSLPQAPRCRHLCHGQVGQIPVCPERYNPEPDSPHTGGATGGTGVPCHYTYLRGWAHLPYPCGTPGGSAVGASWGFPGEPPRLCRWHQVGARQPCLHPWGRE